MRVMATPVQTMGASGWATWGPADSPESGKFPYPTIVSDIRAALPKIKATLPSQLNIRPPSYGGALTAKQKAK